MRFRDELCRTAFQSIQARIKSAAPPLDNLYIPPSGRASIMLALCQFSSPSLIFCERSKILRNHAGEICFPGGKRDPSDPSDLQTALRETWEEVEIPPSTITVLGRLDQIHSRSSLLVSPFVGAVDPDLDVEGGFLPNEEVERVFRVPLSYLEEQHELGEMYRKNSLCFEGHYIWGMTFEVLVRFLDVAMGLDVPQERYELAWRRSDGALHRMPWMQVAQTIREHDQLAPLNVRRVRKI